MSYADLEFSLHCVSDCDYLVELRMQTDPTEAVSFPLGGDLLRLRLDLAALLDVSLDPRAYGRLLSNLLFADERVRSAFSTGSHAAVVVVY